MTEFPGTGTLRTSASAVSQIGRLLCALFVGCCLTALWFGGCATGAGPKSSGKSETRQVAGQKESAKTPAPDTRPKGKLTIDLKNILDKPLRGRVELVSLEDYPMFAFEVPETGATADAPVGAHRAYLYAYDDGIPILVGAQDVTVTQEGPPAAISLRLLEGAAGTLPIRAFDTDGDLAIDRVETELGSNPQDPGIVPGRRTIPLTNRVISDKAGWYRGELHAFSSHGEGSESVAELVRRAEASGMDFLAITDRNTMAAAADPAFVSDKVVLIPAMEWGDDARGVALVYGPRTFPETATTMEAAQAECLRIQAQGGVFAIAHPCFPTCPWQWNLSFVNAIEAWCRDWRSVPPITLDNLGEHLKIRDDKKELIYSIAEAAAITSHSGNAQAAQFWDYELTRGVKVGGIAGSGTASPKVPMGRPITYVYAEEKSFKGIMDGLRLGRTYMSSGPDGPKVAFVADLFDDNTVDLNVGGTFPLSVLVVFLVHVTGANGSKMQILQNGTPIISKNIESDDFVFRFPQMPNANCAYRVRIVTSAIGTKDGFGVLDTLAMTSPIYAQDIIQDVFWNDPNRFLEDKNWIPAKEYDPTPQDGPWQPPLDQEPLKAVPIGR